MKLEIKHTVFQHFGGDIQALGFYPEGQSEPIIRTGVMLPGCYEIVSNKHTEALRITSGKVIINDVSYTESDGDCLLPAGSHIVFVVQEPSTYICRYPGRPIPTES